MTTPEKKKRVKRAKHATPSQVCFLAKIVKKHAFPAGCKKEDKVTFSKPALLEVELIMNNAINLIVQNADQVMNYSGTATLGKQTVEIATTLTLAGLLRDCALKAGSKAVQNYNSFDATAPIPEQVAASL